MDPTLLALLARTGPVVLRRARKLLKDATWVRGLASRVARDAGMNGLRHVVHGWLAEIETQDRIVDYINPDSLELATADLSRRLQQHDPSLSEIDAKAIAEDLVGWTITLHLEALDPEIEAAVSEWRAQERHKQLVALIEGRRPEESVLKLLQAVPPTVRKLVRDAHAVDAVGTARVVSSVLGADPCDAAAQLLASPPSWLEEASIQVWDAFAFLALAYGCQAQGAEIFVRAADLGAGDRGRYLARAAIALAPKNAADAQVLLERARGFGGKPSATLALAEGLFSGDDERILAAAEALSDSNESPWAFAARMEVYIRKRQFTAAIALAEEWLRVNPESISGKVRLARTHLARAAADESPDRSVDLARALKLALDARDAGRAWRTPVGEAVRVACQAAGLSGEHRLVVEIGAGPPDGSATTAEESDPEVLPMSITAALVEERFDVADRLLSHVTDLYEQASLQAEALSRRGAPKEDVVTAWERTWEHATTEEQRIQVWLGMASVGHWPLPGSDEFDQLADGPRVLIAGFAAKQRGELDLAIETLRQGRSSSRNAALLLADTYEESGRIEDAVSCLRDGYSQFRDPAFLVRLVECLARHGLMERAQEAARDGLSAVPSASPQAVLLRRAMIEVSSRLSDWRAVEEQSVALLNDGDEDPQTRWALIIALFNRGEHGRAWDVLQTPPQLEPRNETEALLTVDLFRRFGPQGQDGVQALLAIAEKHVASEQVSAAIQIAILEVARSGELEATIAERLSRERESFFERFPESALFRMIPVPEDPQELLETLTRDMREGAAVYESLREQVWSGHLPYGMLSAASGRPYLQALLQRAAGCLPARSLDPERRMQEVEAVRAALDSSIVTEASVVSLISYHPAVWLQLVSAFSSVFVSDVSYRDMIATRDAFSLPATMFVGIDGRSGKPIVSDVDPEDAQRLLDRSAWCVASASTLNRVAWERFQRLTDFDFPKFGAWLSPLDLAATRGLALWSDDVALRSLAWQMGFQAFGTLALIEVLLGRGSITESDLSAFIDSARAAFVVDFEFDEAKLLEEGRASGWKPGAAGMVLTRPGVWVEGVTRANSFRNVLSSVQAERPENLHAWAAAGFLGFARTSPQDSGRRISGLLAHLFLRLSIPSSELPALLDGAREAARIVNTDDPWIATIELLWGPMLETFGASDGARFMLALLASFNVEDRIAALGVVLRA